MANFTTLAGIEVTWRDVRLWLSGFFAASAIATFVLATLIAWRVRARTPSADQIPEVRVRKSDAGD